MGDATLYSDLSRSFLFGLDPGFHLDSRTPQPREKNDIFAATKYEDNDNAPAHCKSTKTVIAVVVRMVVVIILSSTRRQAKGQRPSEETEQWGSIHAYD